jgi:hypothetical protein
LAVPVVVTFMVSLLLRREFSSVRPEWLIVGAGLVLGYLVFVGTALAFGLDADDQLIARAVWGRVREVFPKGEVGA